VNDSTPGLAPYATGTRLDPILVAVARRAAARRLAQPLAALERAIRPDEARRARFVGALRAAPLAIIAECKRRSPSVGELSAETDVTQRAEAYRRGGASALSILTEEDHFAGSLGDLIAVAPSGLPRLRKDFVLDEGMVLESAAFGADAVLLIAVCLPGPRLGALAALARDVGLATLVEVHDEAELERGLAARPDCLGVNARDLRTFQVDLGVVERLLALVPPDVVRIAESGVHGLAELRRVRDAGADAALIGEALMRAPDPAATLTAWRAALEDDRRSQ